MEHKLKTRDAYKGLDPELLDALKSHKEPQGKDNAGVSCWLRSYRCNAYLPYYVVDDHDDGWWTESFTPMYEEPISVTPTVDTPKDTLCRVWDYKKAGAETCYLFGVLPKADYPFICVDNEKACETGKDITSWRHAEIIEYPDGTRPGEEKWIKPAGEVINIAMEKGYEFDFDGNLMPPEGDSPFITHFMFSSCGKRLRNDSVELWPDWAIEEREAIE